MGLWGFRPGNGFVQWHFVAASHYATSNKISGLLRLAMRGGMGLADGGVGVREAENREKCLLSNNRCTVGVPIIIC